MKLELTVSGKLARFIQRAAKLPAHATITYEQIALLMLEHFWESIVSGYGREEAQRMTTMFVLEKRSLVRKPARKAAARA